MDSPNSFPVTDGYLRELGLFVLAMGRLESNACYVSRALGVTDPGLLSTAVALRKARHQTLISMPPWGRIDALSARDWIDDVLSLLRERNKVLHWELHEAHNYPYSYSLDIPEHELGFVCPHDLDWLATSISHIQDLVRRASSLGERGEEVFEGLCCDTEEWGLIDPMAPDDGVGSGDIGRELDIIDVDWPGPHRKPGGKNKRDWR